MPPFIVHLVVVEHRHALAEFFEDVTRQQNLIEMVPFAEFGELRLGEQLAQFAALGTNGIGMVLPDFNRNVFDFSSGLNYGTENRDWHVSF